MLQVKKEMANILEYKVGNNANFTNFMFVKNSIVSIYAINNSHFNSFYVHVATKTSSYPGWIKSPHVVTCHTYFPIGKGWGG